MVKSIYRTMLDTGAPLSEVLRVMRSDGYSVIQSVAVVKELKGIKIAEAESLVLASDAWADVRDSFKQINDAFARVLLEEADAGRAQGDDSS